MLRRHITCQWNGHAACLISNKCRGRVAQRPYVRLRPLAYVTGSRPRGSIGAPPERGAEAYTVWSGTFPCGSGPTVDTLEYIVFSGHVAAPEPSTWWGRVLFTKRLEIAA
jgi:hypothetical protein